ncbi:MAG: RAMP superfamily CRISPR-associated protein [candidate division KSB1 bacterium]|nr:RAMP superfamily CRISPR-associated protein [candidate division KSB1 bacterium]
MAYAWRALVRITARSPIFTLGPGRSLPMVDRTLLLDEEGRPLILASSVRGRCRAQLERLLRANGQPVCTPPLPEWTCPHNREVALQLGQGPQYCLACRIFGSPWRESAVYFSDFRLDAGEDLGLPTFVTERIGVGMSRKLGAAEEKRLYLTEAGPAGVELHFFGTVEGETEKDELAWLLASLSSLTHLGGQKGRGLGRVRVTVESLAIAQEDGSWKTVDVGTWLPEVLRDAMRTRAS